MCAGPGDRAGHPGIKEIAQDNHPDECKREQSGFPLPAAAFQDRGDDIYLCRRQCASVGRRLAGAPESERRED